jgi:hypothetical protein
MPAGAIEGHHDVTARLLSGAVTAKGQQFAQLPAHRS